MTACFAANCRWKSRRNDRTPDARLAVVMDELRRSRGHSVILRGHDFRSADCRRRDIAASLTPDRHPTANRAADHPSDARVSELRSAPRSQPLLVSRFDALADGHRGTGQAARPAGRRADRHRQPARRGGIRAGGASSAGIKPILGAELRVGDKPLLLYVESARGYHNLCRLLSRHAERTATNADEASVANQQRASVPAASEFTRIHRRIDCGQCGRAGWRNCFRGRFYQLAASRDSREQLSRRRVSGDSLRHARRPAEIRHRANHPHADAAASRSIRRNEADGRFISARRLKWRRRAGNILNGLRHTLEIAERCNFELPFGKPQFPAFMPPDGSPPSEFLRQLVLDGLRRPLSASAGSTSMPRRRSMEELGIISEVGYEEYFLVIWDFLQDCRARGIEWITRGSAAD